MGINRSTVSHRYQETDSYRRRPGQGQPRVTTNREDRNIVNKALRVPTRVARQIGNEALLGRRISTQTIRRRLHERDLKSRISARMPMLTKVHRRTRLCYVIIETGRPDSGEMCCLQTNLDFVCLEMMLGSEFGNVDKSVLKRIMLIQAFGGGSIMVWSGIFEPSNRSSDSPTLRLHSGTLHKQSFASLRDSNASTNRP